MIVKIVVGSYGLDHSPIPITISTSIWQCVKTNSTPVIHIKIAGKWMFIPLKMVLIGIDPYPYKECVDEMTVITMGFFQHRSNGSNGPFFVGNLSMGFSQLPGLVNVYIKLWNITML